MAYQLPLFRIPALPANIDMSVEATKQFSVVDVGPATATTGFGKGGASCLAPVAGGPNLGILQNNPIVGEAADIMSHGISKALAGATITIGGLLMANASGQLIPATATNFAIAKALESAVVGDIFTVLLNNYGKQ